MRPSQWMTGSGTRSPEIWKLSTALVVSPPHSCWLCSVALMALRLGERGDLARDADRVVVGDQEARRRAARAAGVGQQVERLLGRRRAGGSGPRRPTAAAPAGAPARSRRAARGWRRRGGRGRTAPTTARGSRCPPTSANAWRIRSRAAGLPRAERRTPCSGRTAMWAAWESTRSRPGQARRPRAEAPAGARQRPGRRPVQVVGHQHEPRRLEPVGEHRVQQDLRAEPVAADERPRARRPRGRTRPSRRRTSRACRRGGAGPRSRRAAAGRAARPGSGGRGARRPARARGG